MTLPSKGKRNDTLEVLASPIQTHADDTSARHTANHDDIRLRAYEIYLDRGGLSGNDLDDWLQAEHELGRAPQRKTTAISVKEEA